MLSKLQSIETEFGRAPKKIHNEARPLDLDLITFADQARQSEFLTLPHPRALERRFVLQPLVEIAPGLRLPGSSRTVSELLASLPPDPNMVRLGI